MLFFLFPILAAAFRTLFSLSSLFSTSAPRKTHFGLVVHTFGLHSPPFVSVAVAFLRPGLQTRRGRPASGEIPPRPACSSTTKFLTTGRMASKREKAFGASMPAGSISKTKLEK